MRDHSIDHLRKLVWLGAIALNILGCAPTGSVVQPTSSTSPPATKPAEISPSSTARIDSFTGAYRFLSNFWLVAVEYEGITYPSAEHAYQSAKTLDMNGRARIAALPTPGEAKRAGRQLVQRPDWESVKLQVMEVCVRYKFTHHPDLRGKLLATGNAELIEGNTWGDRFWGVCDGQGENHLGKILMKIRAELRAIEQVAD